MEAPEDCALLEMGSERVLVTKDIAPLIGVDMRMAGRISALHAISDIFACGGTPRWALSMLVVDPDRQMRLMEAVYCGVLEACRDEDVMVIGGHTLAGPEAMAGLTVLGTLTSGLFLSKRGAKVGDHLMLSKPLGVGIITHAYKMGTATDEEMESALEIMSHSNRGSSEIAVEVRATAATDVSGFGLLGHLTEMLEDSQGATLVGDRVPVLPAAIRLAKETSHCDLTLENLKYARSRKKLASVDVRDPRMIPLLDPQTNGGLLLSVDAGVASDLEQRGFYDIGTVTASGVLVMET
jgi:selenide,water dikinase